MHLLELPSPAGCTAVQVLVIKVHRSITVYYTVYTLIVNIILCMDYIILMISHKHKRISKLNFQIYILLYS